MRLVRKSLLTLCSLLLAVSVLIPQTTVHAADQKWMNQVWSEYQSYNKKTVNAYNTYQKQADKKYQQFYDESHASLDQLERTVLEDQKQWDEKLQADLDQLKLKYEGNRDLKDKLAQYERFINPSYLNSPMWKYANAANRHYLNSTLWKLSKEMNEDYLNSLMWTYKKTIDPDYLNSSAWKFNKTVSETYLNSPMWKLRNGSSTSYLNSPMWKYKHGKISKATAKSQYSKLFKEQTTAISKSNAARKSEIEKMASGTQKKIGELYKETVITLETRREEALKSISDLRIEITGEGLQWETLLVERP
ncbi:MULTISPECIES: hypothetical protein [Paenibacillus]|uniref:Uncharacterized protein n=1 Tax=Paenibacillus lautus TaxID=1401 RepID=A0A1R1B220_PAELA|nr:hypothetical protein [Paenibacillus lautus]OME92845.1 hypothetical protein BK123_13275 [Paenibacillus lautus]